MNLTCLFFFLLLACTARCQKHSPAFFAVAGAEYRQYQIDVEDVPRGPLPGNNGLPSDDSRFWKAISLDAQFGVRVREKWSVSLSTCVRYNLLHRLEGINIDKPYPKSIKEKKNFKYDLFFDIEKNIRLKKNKERYLFAIAGIGFTNINSAFDIILTDSYESGIFPSHHYQGTFLHFTPHINIGYRYKKIRVSVNTYFVEDPLLANLTSLWIGSSVNYEIDIRKKK